MNHPELYDERHLCDGDWPDEEGLTLAEDMQQEAEWQDYAEQYLKDQKPV